MIRKIIQIDEEKCNGCGACASACHEGAIAMVDGKAKLMRDDYCDGFGDCLPQCPTGAITFVEREAAAYDEAAVLESKKKKAEAMTGMKLGNGTGAGGAAGTAGNPGAEKPVFAGCPGSRMHLFNRKNTQETPGNQPAAQGGMTAAAACPSGAQASGTGQGVSSDALQAALQAIAQLAPQGGGQLSQAGASFAPGGAPYTQAAPQSQLGQWPCQIKLVPVNAPYFDGAKLLIAADCTAYAYANVHQEFMKGKITLIGCPKLDAVDYSEKLTQILANNDIKSLTVLRMEVPCCGGLEMAAKKALQASGKFIPWQVVTFSIDGRILD